MIAIVILMNALFLVSSLQKMSFQMNVPPSFVAKMAKTEKEVTEEEPTGKKREDWRKLKELEEARKAGTAPAMQDEEGKSVLFAMVFIFFHSTLMFWLSLFFTSELQLHVYCIM